MVTSVHFKNVFKALSENCRGGGVSKYLIFIADNVLMVEDGSGSTVVVPRLTAAPPKKAAAAATSGDSDDSSDCAVSASPLRSSVTARTAGGSGLKISVNKIPLEIAAVFFNEAVSFVPCFRCGKQVKLRLTMTSRAAVRKRTSGRDKITKFSK